MRSTDAASIAGRVRRGAWISFVGAIVVAVAVAAVLVGSGAGVEADLDDAAVAAELRAEVEDVRVGLGSIVAEGSSGTTSTAVGAATGELRRDLALVAQTAPGLATRTVTLPGGGASDLVTVLDRGLVAAEALADGVVGPDSTVGDLARADLGLAVEALDAAVADGVADATAGVGWFPWLAVGLVAAALVVHTARLVALELPALRRLDAEHALLVELEADQEREQLVHELANDLGQALEIADTEEDVHRTAARTFDRVAPDAPAEVLLADSSRARVTAVAESPRAGRAACGVPSPGECPAVRRGQTLVYDDATAIDACAHLVPRAPCSAVCVPVAFMGESLGVVHVLGPAGEPPGRARREALEQLAGQVGTRVGTLRTVARAELQASTDTLTGVANRRSTEAALRRMLIDHDVVAVAMADLDRFRVLNDRFGHEAGDRTLRLFAEAARAALRGEDLFGRWGGEEFIVALPATTATEAEAVLRRIGIRLAQTLERAEAPRVTVSIGVVDSSMEAGVEAVVRLADEALLAAKSRGRDRVVVGPATSEEHLADVGEAVSS